MFQITLSYCSKPTAPDEKNRFALYLLKNDTLTTKDVENIKLWKLILQDNPVISYKDLVAYQIENHKVYLNAKFSYYFNTDSLKIFSCYLGKPFVLIASGERIYVGSFISGISSWSSNTPKIVDFSINNTEKSFIISGAPIYHKLRYVDVRNDKRILLALGDKIID